MIKSFITHDVSKQMEKEIFKLFVKIKIFSIRRKKTVKSITYIFVWILKKLLSAFLENAIVS